MWAVLIIGATGFGCSCAGDGPQASNKSGKSLPAPGQPGGEPDIKFPGPGETKKPGESPITGMDPEDATIEFPEKTFAISEPETEDWEPAPAPEKKTLGQKIDDALASLTEAYADTSINYDVADVGKLQGKAQVRIRDRDTYMIEYITPETEASINRVVRNGEKSRELYDAEWRDVKAGKVPTSDADFQNLPKTLLRDIHSVHRDGRGYWGPLIDGLQAGKGGYETTVEERNRDAIDKNRPFYRVYARREKGDTTTIEILVDGERHLPLTVRVVEKKADGTESKQMWNGNWAFGGEHEDSFFAVP